MDESLGQIPAAPLVGNLKLWLSWLLSGAATLTLGLVGKILGDKMATRFRAHRARKQEASTAQANALHDRLSALEGKVVHLVSVGQFELKSASILEAIHASHKDIKLDVARLAARLDNHIDHRPTPHQVPMKEMPGGV